MKTISKSNISGIYKTLKTVLFFCLFFISFSASQYLIAQPSTPVGFVANPSSGPGQVFLACGPNDVGANNIIYRLFYSPTASAPLDPLSATEYSFGSTGGDGGGTSAFGFTITGLTPSTEYTFWLYQYNTATMEFSASPAIATQTSGGGGPPATPVGFVANPSSGPGQVFLACGPNDVGANNVVYKLFYSPTASAPADPLAATEYIFGSTGGDGGGTSAFGFTITGLTPSTDYTFWLYQYNTATMEYSDTPAIATQTSGAGGPPATPVGFVANPSSGSGQVFLACGPNDVGANNIVYKLFYSPTASAPADPLTATEYIFGTTGGDGGGSSAFGFTITSLTPNTEFTFWLYQYNTATMEFSASPATATQTSSGTTLPVVWHDQVKASVTNGTVKITWSLSQQVDNDNFFIEYSHNGKDFARIGNIKGGGTTNTLQKYSFIHENPTVGYNYYRIHQVDYDGRSDKSNIAKVRFDGDQKIMIYPNPASSIVTMSLTQQSNLNVKDVYGRVVKNMSLTEGKNVVSIDDMPNGIYILEFETGQVEVFIKK